MSAISFRFPKLEVGPIDLVVIVGVRTGDIVGRLRPSSFTNRGGIAAVSSEELDGLMDCF
jgi:hypothetical protein